MTISLSDDLRRRVETIARAEHRSLSNAISHMLASIADAIGRPEQKFSAFEQIFGASRQVLHVDGGDKEMETAARRYLAHWSSWPTAQPIIGKRCAHIAALRQNGKGWVANDDDE